MDIIYKIDVDEIENEVLKVARYQQVALCFDVNSNLELVSSLKERLSKKTMLFCYNFDNEYDITKIINDGIKCVISMLSFYNFIKLKKQTKTNFFLIDILQDNFICPHIILENKNTKLFTTSKLKSCLADSMFLTANLIDNKFQKLSSYTNDMEQEKLLSTLADFVLEKDVSCELVVKLINKVQIALDIKELCVLKDIVDIAFYYYAVIVAYKYLFLQFASGEYFIADIYKQYQNNMEQINLSYQIIFNEQLIYLLKTNSEFMVEFIDVFLNKINILLFKIINKIKINNILKILKNNIKLNNKDNLLKICYLFGIFEAI